MKKEPCYNYYYVNSKTQEKKALAVLTTMLFVIVEYGPNIL